MTQVRTKLGDNGRLVIPVQYRKALDIEPGDDIILVLEEDGMRVLTPAAAIKRTQDLVRRSIPPGRSLSNELIAERRAEAARE